MPVAEKDDHDEPIAATATLFETQSPWTQTASRSVVQLAALTQTCSEAQDERLTQTGSAAAGTATSDADASRRAVARMARMHGARRPRRASLFWAPLPAT